MEQQKTIEKKKACIVSFLNRRQRHKLFFCAYGKSMKNGRLYTFRLFRIYETSITGIYFLFKGQKLLDYKSGKYYRSQRYCNVYTANADIIYDCVFGSYSTKNRKLNYSIVICTKEKLMSLIHSSLIWKNNSQAKKNFKNIINQRIAKFNKNYHHCITFSDHQ